MARVVGHKSLPDAPTGEPAHHSAGWPCVEATGAVDRGLARWRANQRHVLGGMSRGRDGGVRLLGPGTAAAVIAEAATRAGLSRAEAERTAWSGIRRTRGIAHA
jgi:hypothetical protein